MSPPQRETERGSIYQQNPESQGLDQVPTPKGTWEPKYIFAEQDCTPKYQTKDLSQSYALLSPLKVAKVSKPDLSNQRPDQVSQLNKIENKKAPSLGLDTPQTIN